MTHPNDTLGALDWAVGKAEQDAATDDLVRLVYLPALREKRDEAKREAGK